jgi:hypothetical protein
MYISTHNASASENLAAHRAQQLTERLPSALCNGRTEEGPLKVRLNPTGLAEQLINCSGLEHGYGRGARYVRSHVAVLCSQIFREGCV